jgi:hypothetical protein
MRVSPITGRLIEVMDAILQAYFEFVFVPEFNWVTLYTVDRATLLEVRTNTLVWS